MDPNAALKAMRDLAKSIDVAEDGTFRASLGEDLATLFQGLDGWLSKGGFPPVDWGTMGR